MSRREKVSVYLGRLSLNLWKHFRYILRIALRICTERQRYERIAGKPIYYNDLTGSTRVTTNQFWKNFYTSASSSRPLVEELKNSSFLCTAPVSHERSIQKLEIHGRCWGPLTSEHLTKNRQKNKDVCGRSDADEIWRILEVLCRGTIDSKK